MPCSNILIEEQNYFPATKCYTGKTFSLFQQISPMPKLALVSFHEIYDLEFSSHSFKFCKLKYQTMRFFLLLKKKCTTCPDFFQGRTNLCSDVLFYWSFVKANIMKLMKPSKTCPLNSTQPMKPLINDCKPTCNGQQKVSSVPNS